MKTKVRAEASSEDIQYTLYHGRRIIGKNIELFALKRYKKGQEIGEAIVAVLAYGGRGR